MFEIRSEKELAKEERKRKRAKRSTCIKNRKQMSLH